ncbi:MAG TPA: glycoside hydrolase family 2 TIM barrel-domain containing protein [Verrucomicrobiae bacterium]|nr:glycoside hydrolase family 2 TIM barrel-domain containing protein [Verrucomicrobiae bacterium]
MNCGNPLLNTSTSTLAMGIAVILCLAALPGVGAESRLPQQPVKAEIHFVNGKYQLYVDHQPFFIKGAGLEFGSQEKLAEHGGNSFRTWRTENGRESGREVLNRALKNHLYVTMGLDLARERHGFDYNDAKAVQRQFEQIKAEVLKYKDHPALIAWAIGNELNLGSKNPKVWDAVNDISRMIHQVDPNHLTTTPLAGISKELVQEIKTRAPDLDFLSIQMYADIINLPRYLRETGWTGPYVVSEWGATGHWEIAKTAWGAPIENNSTTKADLYLKRYLAAIASDSKQCLGSYVFLWGQKQERTPTWYGMFLESGEETATVDALQYLWTGKWPQNRSPRVDGAWLDGKQASQNIHLQAGCQYKARVVGTDPDKDPLTYSWELLEESTDLKWGGDFERRPPAVTNAVENPASSEIVLRAPARPGAYRLFAYLHDGKGHAAHINIPFYVDAAKGENLQTAGR